MIQEYETNMARPSERMRLKDKIVDDISKAIKSIQEQVYYLSKDPSTASCLERGNLILSNGDRQSHKLCDKLDHAFLHGLKDVTHGYWKLFKVLSHKGMTREIDVLTNVTTDLGRGRAWLYISLNEGLLESYIRLLGENEKLVKKHYNKEALVLDGDRMNVLLTLTSGLDFVTFQLEYDLPYLDLSPSPPRTQSGYNEEYVKDGFQKKRISPVSLSNRQSDSDTASISSIQSSTFDRSVSRTSSMADSGLTLNSEDSKDQAHILHSGIGCHLDRSLTPTEVLLLNNERKIKAPADAQSINSTGSDLNRHERFENIINSNKDLADDMDDSLEVIRVVNKKKKKKSKPNSAAGMNKANSKSSRSLSSASESTPERTITELNNAVDATSLPSFSKAEENEALQNQSCENFETSGSNALSSKGVVIPQLDSGIDICDITSEKASAVSDNIEFDDNVVCIPKKETPDELDSNIYKREDVMTDINKSVAEEKSSLSVIESKIAEMCRDPRKERTTSSHSLSGQESRQRIAITEGDNSLNGFVDSNGSKIGAETEDSVDFYSPPVKTCAQEQNKHSSLAKKLHPEDEHTFSSEKVARSSSPLATGGDDLGDFYDVYSSTKSPLQGKSHNIEIEDENRPYLTRLQEVSHLQDYVDCVLKGDESTLEDHNAVKSEEATDEDFAVRLDNNTKLQVMLEIFKQEDETFVKMFACRENHTEGNFSVAFVLISDQYLYLLHYKQQNRKFIIQSVTKLTDIIFISTGLYEQTLNIESRDKSRQKQRLWLTPGHQDLTKAIVQCLTDVVKEANAGIVSVRSRFSVGSDVPLQKIGLRKYISQEMHCEATDVLINDYSLVFWEDPSSSKSSYSDSVTKEGTLLLRVQDPIKGFIWKPFHVVLQGSMLSVSNSKSDPRPHSHLGLGGDQCIGCRLTEVGERPHCVELVLAQGVSWYLSAASENEILDWRRSLCLAVSQGVEESGMLSGCIPCCCIQASNQLFLCHEDLDTKFFRTLGRAQMEDVTGILMDRKEPTYCVVEFESQEVGVSSGKWVFHFASASDTNRFTTSLVSCWKEIFQVDLPISVLEDVTLQRHCQSYAKQLCKPFELR